MPASGQGWTSLEQLRKTRANTFRQDEADVLHIITAPAFAIGQRAFLIRTGHGNVLWDCITLLDAATITLIRSLGGVAAIAISHPHYYTTMGRWSEAFGAPVFIHEADRQWVLRQSGDLRFWSDDSREILPGLTLVRCGGHFAGGAVLHWTGGEAGRGTLFCGDILQVVPDRRHVSFMRSYPNLVPLSAPVVQRIVDRLRPYPYDRIYGAFADRTISTGGEAAVARSAERYIAAISGSGPADQEA